MQDLKLQKTIYTKHDAGNTFLIAILAPQIVGFFLMLVINVISSIFNLNYEELIESSMIISFLGILIGPLIFFLTFFIYNKVTKTNYKKASEINFKIGLPAILIPILMGIIVLFGFAPLINIFDYLISLTGHNAAELPLPLDNIGWLFLNLFCLAVLPAIFEELVFRGIIFHGLKHYGKVWAIFGSALLFALMHGSVDQALYPFIFGLSMALVVLKTNSIIPAIAMHFFNNSFVIIINYIVNVSNIVTESEPYVLTVQEVITSIVYAFIAGCAVYFLSKTLKNKSELQTHSTNNQKTENTNNQNEIEAVKIETNQNSEQSNNPQFSTFHTRPNTTLWIGVAIGCVLWVLQSFLM